eukprot:1802144-Alexandrium_andersonii.AAC.1
MSNLKSWQHCALYDSLKSPQGNKGRVQEMPDMRGSLTGNAPSPGTAAAAAAAVGLPRGGGRRP